MRPRRHQQALLLVAAGALLASGWVPVVTRASPAGPLADVLGAEAGSEKARIVEQAQREHELGLRATLGPARGRPPEEWNPPIVEGIIDEAESPFEGEPFVLVNLWQSRRSVDGRVTRVYAGTEGGRALLVVLRQVVLSGERELYREVELPPGVGAPRLTAAGGGLLEVATASGRLFRFDVERMALLSAPLR